MAPQDLRARLTLDGHVPPSPWVPLRGGRSNRLWRVGEGAAAVVVKLYGTPDENPLFRNDARAERRALAWLEGRGMAPALCHADAGTEGHVLVYTHIAGDTWRTDPRPVADLLARLHRTDPPPGLPLRPGGSRALAEEAARILALCPKGPALSRLKDAWPGGAAVSPSDHRAFLHGDPVPGNLILAETGPVLIDWQCPAIGDPVEDIALFLSPAMQIAYRGAPLTDAETGAFLDGYGDAALARRYRQLAPWFHWRMAAYCLWRGAADTGGMEAELAALAAY